MFECGYTKFAFQHLCGVHSQTYSAGDFYDECIKDNSAITIDDCTPAYQHTWVEVQEKTESLINLLNIKNLNLNML